MPAYAHEVELARRRGRRVPLPHQPGRLRRRRTASRRSTAPRCGSASPDESGRRRPEPVPGSEFVIPRRHRRQGDRPAAARRVSGSRLELERDRRSTRRPHAETRRSLPPETQSTAAPASSRPWRRPSAPRGDRRGTAMNDDDRDPLARARRPGREDGCADARAGAAAHRQERPGVPRVRARAPRGAAARVHARRRPPDPPSRLGHRPRTSSSCSSRRSCTKRTSPTGWRRRDSSSSTAKRRHPSSPASTCGVFRPAARDHARLGFVNIVMLGAVAAALGEPPLADLQEAAVETLGRKVAADDVRAALCGGIRMAELSAWETLPRRAAPCVRDGAPRTLTGGWRTGCEAGRRRVVVRELPALLALLPRLGGHALDGDDIHGLRPRLLQGLRDLRRGLSRRRDRDGGRMS